VPFYIYFFFLTSFFLLLSREIIKGCEDIEGDEKEGVKTLAIRIGIEKSAKISMTFAILAIIFFILPLFTNIINHLFFLISMFFGLGAVVYAVIIMIKRNLARNDFKKASLILKLGAYLGLIAFLFASF
jgi:4-hydroxybenzoate polyprenyltransferase